MEYIAQDTLARKCGRPPNREIAKEAAMAMVLT